VRVRPPLLHERVELSGGKTVKSDSSPTFTRAVFPDVANRHVYVKEIAGSYRRFAFDAIHDGDATQGAVFRRLALPVVDDVLAGVAGAVLCCGATNTGKTYTMGLLKRLHPFVVTRQRRRQRRRVARERAIDDDDENDDTDDITDDDEDDGGNAFVDDDGEGIVSRSLAHIFDDLTARSAAAQNLDGGGSGDGHLVAWRVSLSFVQLVGESIDDLLVKATAGEDVAASSKSSKRKRSAKATASSSTKQQKRTMSTRSAKSRSKSKTEVTLRRISGGDGGGGGNAIGGGGGGDGDVDVEFEGCRRLQCRSYDEAIAVVDAGRRRRLTAATRANA
jgi:hypothetical protein